MTLVVITVFMMVMVLPVALGRPEVHMSSEMHTFIFGVYGPILAPLPPNPTPRLLLPLCQPHPLTLPLLLPLPILPSFLSSGPRPPPCTGFVSPVVRQATLWLWGTLPRVF